MKKTIIMLLAVCMVLSLMAGCGGAASSGSAKSAEPSAPAQPAAPTAEPAPATEPEPAVESEPVEEGFVLPLVDEVIDVTGWTGWSTFIDQYFTIDEKSVFVELERLTNVHVDWDPQSTAEMQSTSLAILAASGDYYDIYEDLGNYYAGGLAAAYNDDFIIDYAAYSDCIPNLLGRLAENESWYKGTYNDDGQILFAPYLMQNSFEGTPYVGMLTRGDWLEALNMDAPTTYDEFYAMLQAYKSEYNSTMHLSWTGATSGNTLAAGFNTYLFYDPYKSGVKQPFYLDENGKVQCGYYKSEGMVEFYTMMNKWYKEGLIYQDFMTITNTVENTLDDVLLNGTCGVFFCNPSMLRAKIDGLEGGGSIVALADVGKDGIADTGLDGFGEGMVQIGSGRCISAQSEYIEILARMTDYYYTDEGIMLCNYGVEGEGYTMVDGKPQFSDLILKNPDGMPTMMAMNRYAYMFAPTVNISDRTDFGGFESGYYNVWGQNSIDRVFPADAVFTAEETEEYNHIYSEVQTCISEWAPALVTGDKSIDDIEVLWQQLADLGIEKVLELRQASYDRYLAR